MNNPLKDRLLRVLCDGGVEGASLTHRQRDFSMQYLNNEIKHKMWSQNIQSEIASEMSKGKSESSKLASFLGSDDVLIHFTHSRYMHGVLASSSSQTTVKVESVTSREYIKIICSFKTFVAWVLIITNLVHRY
jgi:hypothetical protein